MHAYSFFMMFITLLYAKHGGSILGAIFPRWAPILCCELKEGQFGGVY